MPFAYLCDFDGTISPADIGAEFVHRFTTREPSESAALIERWRAGLLGNRELAAAECAGLSVSIEEALAFTGGFSLDPHFSSFVVAAVRRGDRVAVVSEGFDFYVRDRLEQHGLADLPWSANRACFEGGRVRLEFPHLSDDGCPGCGNCKASHVRRHRSLGYQVVLVGDGLSDRCAARSADHVLARDALLEWCQAEGIAALEFESFADVDGFARRLAHAAGGHTPENGAGAGAGSDPGHS